MDRDEIAFLYFWALDDEADGKFMENLWEWSKNRPHLSPHDAPITCNRCVVDECYRFSDRYLEFINNKSLVKK